MITRLQARPPSHPTSLPPQSTSETFCAVPRRCGRRRIAWFPLGSDPYCHGPSCEAQPSFLPEDHQVLVYSIEGLGLRGVLLNCRPQLYSGLR
jgi:hypothetical protein